MNKEAVSIFTLFNVMLLVVISECQHQAQKCLGTETNSSDLPTVDGLEHCRNTQSQWLTIGERRFLDQ